MENEIAVKTVCFGVNIFLPVLPEGENAFTWNRYQGELKDQSCLRKDRRNSELIKRLMDKTFSYRRHVIIKGVLRLKDLFDKFPLIRIREQVHIKFYIFLNNVSSCSVIVISYI